MDQTPFILHCSLQENFDESKDSQYQYLKTGHKMGNSCSDSVYAWGEVASNIDFQM